MPSICIYFLFSRARLDVGLAGIVRILISFFNILASGCLMLGSTSDDRIVHYLLSSVGRT